MTYKAYITFVCIFIILIDRNGERFILYNAKSFPSIAAYVLCENDQVAITYIKEL
jgi:hypothetical protein